MGRVGFVPVERRPVSESTGGGEDFAPTRDRTPPGSVDDTEGAGLTGETEPGEEERRKRAEADE